MSKTKRIDALEKELFVNHLRFSILYAIVARMFPSMHIFEEKVRMEKDIILDRFSDILTDDQKALLKDPKFMFNNSR